MDKDRMQAGTTPTSLRPDWSLRHRNPASLPHRIHLPTSIAVIAYKPTQRAIYKDMFFFFFLCDNLILWVSKPRRLYRTSDSTKLLLKTGEHCKTAMETHYSLIAANTPDLWWHRRQFELSNLFKVLQ